jgi:FKBP-type peptidyl-prolyl cis-trans isomerase
MKRFSNVLFATALAASIASLGACQKADKKDKDDKAAKTTDGTKAGASRPDPTNKGPKPGDIPAPADVAAAPADAMKTENGVHYKVLTPAAAPGDKPGVNDTVEVHYTGWTTDGKMFDSSVKRGQPATFGLGKVIAGWTEGLQVMTTGEKTRFWIPEELAYKGRKGAPAGMLVFDVELISIKKAPKPPADVAGPPAGAEKTELGVSYKVLKKGDGGEKPNAWDKVKVHYSGWTTDGKMFDSSMTRAQPAQFAVNGVIAGWTDVLQQMNTGDKWLIWIPEDLAYKGAPRKPAGMLVFEVELLEVTRMPEPPKAPEDVAAPPANAKKTEKGVSYKVLEAGKGGPKPTPADKVEVHYSGWTTDGKMFDSSVTRGRTATFPLTAVIAGWTDGLQVMSVGDKVRFWIPEALAYKGQAGKPAGMLVFDVELVSIKAPAAKKPIAPKSVAPKAIAPKAEAPKAEATKK